jgi:furin
MIIPGRSVSKSTLEVTACDAKFLEHVQCYVTLGASRRGDVVINLVSPSGTRSNLIARRPKDYSRSGFNDWPFLTVSWFWFNFKQVDDFSSHFYGCF